MLIVQQFLLFVSRAVNIESDVIADWTRIGQTGTFAIMVIAAIPNAETGGNIANLMFSLCLIFCGVLAGPDTLGWWIWMYRISPFS